MTSTNSGLFNIQINTLNDKIEEKEENKSGVYKEKNYKNSPYW